MAQTRKRRRSKHRGTAAGNIEARGRTGRKLSSEERAKAKPAPGARSVTKGGKGAARPNRFDTPPTWRAAFNRALIASVFFAVFAVLLTRSQHRPLASALPLIAFVLLIYVPLGYYTDKVFYARRQRRKAQGK